MTVLRSPKGNSSSSLSLCSFGVAGKSSRRTTWTAILDEPAKTPKRDEYPFHTPSNRPSYISFRKINAACPLYPLASSFDLCPFLSRQYRIATSAVVTVASDSTFTSFNPGQFRDCIPERPP